MNSRYLLISLVCLGWLLTAGCTPPVEPAPTVPATMPALSGTPTPTTRPITTPTPVATPLPDTLTPTFEPGASPVRPTLSLPEVRASQTALWADIYATTPTWTPSPTSTPISGPIWRILFRAVPCPRSINECGIDLYMHDVSRWYLIDSDGSDLVALEDTEPFLTDMYIGAEPHLSPDGTHLAYLAKTDDEVHLMLSEIASVQTSDLGVAPQEFRELRFLSEPGCLAVYSSPGWDDRPVIEMVTVTKLCAGSTERQILGIVEFPNIRPFSRYRLSPQGDALLIWTRNANSILELYIYEFGSQEPPRLLFAAEDNTWFLGAARWLPDGQSVEFIAQQSKPDGLRKVLVYASNRQPTDIQVKLELDLPFGLSGMGNWSPDGREVALFPGIPKNTPETSGVYILDLESGEWRQIISGFYDVEPYVQAWQAEVP